MIDINYLNEISDGDHEFLEDLIRIYLQQFPGYCRNMREFAASRRYSELEKEAHKAKSSALVLKLSDLSSLLADLQRVAANQESPDACAGLIGKIEAGFDSTAKELLILTSKKK